ncbi:MULTISPECIES: scabin-related ADP-ribosyltransferase [Methylobacterium]
MPPAPDNDANLLTHASTNTVRIKYVATSESHSMAGQFAGKNGYVYVIKSGRSVDANKSLGSRSPFPGQLEFAMPDGIKPSEILGAYPMKVGSISGPLIPNPNFGT